MPGLPRTPVGAGVRIKLCHLRPKSSGRDEEGLAWTTLRCALRETKGRMSASSVRSGALGRTRMMNFTFLRYGRARPRYALRGQRRNRLHA